MDAEIKTKWVAALRSGEYQQTTGTFERDGKYCCLGVLCLVSGHTFGVPKAEVSAWDCVDSHLPRGSDINLYTMNDSDRMSFSEIADWIEENL